MTVFQPVFRKVMGPVMRPVVRQPQGRMFGMYSESQLNTMITSEAYIPIATADELNALRNATAQTFGAGSLWEGTYTSGLDKKYVQIDDIDLDVAPYNAGEGWNPLGKIGQGLTPFRGSFDAAGRFITGLFLNSSEQYTALFGASDTGCQIKNLAIEVNILFSGNYAAGILGRGDDNVLISNCFVFGKIKGGAYVAGVYGYNSNTIGDVKIQNCFSVVAAYASANYCGGIAGLMRHPENKVQTSLSIGFHSAEGIKYGSVSGDLLNSAAAVKSYWNNETTPYDAQHGTPKTTAELLAGTPSASIYTDWDTSIWEFKADRYPIQRIFGEQAVHRAPPLQPTATIDGGNIVLTWTDAPLEVDLPDGYFVYQSIDNGPWTKLNATAVTDKTYTVTSPAVGEHNYFIAAYYNDAAYKIKETGNSQTVTETIA